LGENSGGGRKATEGEKEIDHEKETNVKALLREKAAKITGWFGRKPEAANLLGCTAISEGERAGNKKIHRRLCPMRRDANWRVL